MFHTSGKDTISLSFSSDSKHICSHLLFYVYSRIFLFYKSPPGMLRGRVVEMSSKKIGRYEGSLSNLLWKYKPQINHMYLFLSQLPSTAMWGQPNASSPPSTSTPTLTQIQQMQQEQRDREEVSESGRGTAGINVWCLHGVLQGSVFGMCFCNGISKHL